jgi:hypothetical protein
MMLKHLLVAVRDAKICPQGVRFAGNFFENRQDFSISLLYLTGDPTSQTPDTMWNEGSSPGKGSASTPEEQCFALARRNLLRKGFLESGIKTTIKSRVAGTGKDILSEGQSGYYDAVVLGSSGYSFLEGLVRGDVGREILESGLHFPIWFCRDIEEERRNVLLCLDGSVVGDRVAAHVGYMLQGETKHSITLLYIGTGQDLEPGKIFSRATEILLDHDFPPEKITSQIIRSSRVVKTILSTVDKGRFAVVALGWSGRSPHTGIKKWLAGEKCREVLDNINKVALWIVP